MLSIALNQFTKPAALFALTMACIAMPNASAQEDGDDVQSRLEASRAREEVCRRPAVGEAFARTQLFFGLSKPGGAVTDEEFQRFLDEYITPRFPDGLTLLAGTGQFRDASGVIIGEGAKLLILLYPPRGRDGRDSSEKIELIPEDYKRLHQQQSVLRADDRSCVSF